MIVKESDVKVFTHIAVHLLCKIIPFVKAPIFKEQTEENPYEPEYVETSGITAPNLSVTANSCLLHDNHLMLTIKC